MVAGKHEGTSAAAFGAGAGAGPGGQGTAAAQDVSEGRAQERGAGQLVPPGSSWRQGVLQVAVHEGRPLAAGAACRALSIPACFPPCRYEEGANISQVDTLVELAQELGLPVEEVRRHLEEDRGRAAVLAEDAHGKKE